jgi:integrase
MAREPGYCLHKPTGQAYVRFDGKPFYLGEFGSEVSKERYNRLKAEWLVNRHSAKFKPKASAGPTVSDVCNAYLDHAEAYYSASNEYRNLKLACGPLSELFATMPASEFGILQYRACRDWWLSTDTRSRQYINKQMKRMLRVFKWAVGEGMIPAAIHETLKCVATLKRGRTKAQEAKRVVPVEVARVEATLPNLTQVVSDMIRFQSLVGCRPGEVCSITPGMVNRSGEVWTITLETHKTAWRGKSRTIYVGPKAQAILAKYLLRAADSACFSPIESERQRLEDRHAARTTPLDQGNIPGSNIARKPRKAPGEAYTTGSYAKAIKYACQRGKLDPWSPNQLRHNAATAIRKQFGLEAAQVILGHSEIGTTQVYAEQDTAKAIAVAKAVG